MAEERRKQHLTKEDVEAIVKDVITKEVAPTLKEVSEAILILTPFIEGIQGSKVFTLGFKWLAGIIITFGAMLFAMKQMWSLIHF